MKLKKYLVIFFLILFSNVKVFALKGTPPPPTPPPPPAVPINENIIILFIFAFILSFYIFNKEKATQN